MASRSPDVGEQMVGPQRSSEWKSKSRLALRAARGVLWGAVVLAGGCVVLGLLACGLPDMLRFSSIGTCYRIVVAAGSFGIACLGVLYILRRPT